MAKKLKWSKDRMIVRHTSAHRIARSKAVTVEQSPEPEVCCRVSPAVRISLVAGGGWAVQQRKKKQWINEGYHSSFYHAAKWLFQSRPDMLSFGELGHLDSLLRAYDVALAKLRVLAEPLSRENQQLRIRVAQLEKENAKLRGDALKCEGCGTPLPPPASGDPDLMPAVCEDCADQERVDELRTFHGKR